MNKKAFIKDLAKYLADNGKRALETFSSSNIKKLTGVRDDLVTALAEDSGLSRETIKGGIRTLGEETGIVRESIENKVKLLRDAKIDISSQLSSLSKQNIEKTTPQWTGLVEKQRGIIQKLDRMEPLLDDRGIRSSFRKLEKSESKLTKAIRRRRIAWGGTGVLGTAAGTGAYSHMAEDPLYRRVMRQQADRGKN